MSKLDLIFIDDEQGAFSNSELEHMARAGDAVKIIPTIVAGANKKSNIGAIFILNLFIGWVVSLVWAVSKDAPVQQVIIQNQQPSNTGE